MAGKRTVVSFLGVLALAISARVLFSPGFTGTDDVVYAIRGAEIASGIWRPSYDVGELRYGVNLPISFFIRFFGATPFGFNAWSLLCSIAEVSLVFWLASYIWGLRAAILSGLIIALTPIHVILGGVPLADAPLAFLFSLALVSFFYAERAGKTWLYVLAGAAAGFAWWVKPVAAIPFALIFVVYALVWRVWRREWLLVIAVGAGVVALELTMLWIKFGDPFYSINASRIGLSRTHMQSDLLWGSRSPLFYFQQMFLDGRDMWITPHLALGGLLFISHDQWRRGKVNFGSSYVTFWALVLISIFSFFVYSLDPLLFIPKQTNYALIFFAPIALLGGYALSRLKGLVLIISVGIFLGGVLVLSALQGLGDELNYSALKKAETFARGHPEALVFVPQHVINAAYLANLATGNPSPPENFVPLRDLPIPRPTSQPFVERVRYAIADPLAPEMSKPAQGKKITQTLSSASWQKIVELRPESNGIGRPVVTLLERLRPHLPLAIDRHLSFTDRLISPRAVEIFREDQRR